MHNESQESAITWFGKWFLRYANVSILEKRIKKSWKRNIRNLDLISILGFVKRVAKRDFRRAFSPLIEKFSIRAYRVSRNKLKSGGRDCNAGKLSRSSRYIVKIVVKFYLILGRCQNKRYRLSYTTNKYFRLES